MTLTDLVIVLYKEFKDLIKDHSFEVIVIVFITGFIATSSTWTVVDRTIIEQKKDNIKNLNDELSRLGYVKEQQKAEIDQLKKDLNDSRSVIEGQKAEILKLKSIIQFDGNVICKQPQSIIWEIGYDDSRYGEFDQLSVYPGRFPWEYNVGEPFDRFPKEVNDGLRTPIRIKFSLNDTQLKSDLVLTIIIESVNKDFFDLRIRTQNDVIGTYTFNNTKKMHKIVISKDKIIAGENTIVLENANTVIDGRWLFWDYLSLKTCVSE